MWGGGPRWRLAVRVRWVEGHELVSQHRRSRNIGNALAINNNALVIYILTHTHTLTHIRGVHTHRYTRTHTSRPVNIVCVC